MLSSISWQQYLFAVATGASAYYVIVLISYFRGEALTILKGCKPQNLSQETRTTPEVMGRAKEEFLNPPIPSEELQFSSEADNESTDEN